MKNPHEYQKLLTYWQDRLQDPVYYGETGELDDGMKNIKNLLSLSDKLSFDAKIEFSKKWFLEFALEGEIYLGGERSARAECQNLLNECEKLGMSIVYRGNNSRFTVHIVIGSNSPTPTVQELT